MMIEFEKSRFVAVGWKFEEIKVGTTWQVIAKRQERILLVHSHVREKAWESLFEAIKRVDE